MQPQSFPFRNLGEQGLGCIGKIEGRLGSEIDRVAEKLERICSGRQSGGSGGGGSEWYQPGTIKDYIGGVKSSD